MAKTYYRGGKPYRHVDDSGKSRRVTSDPIIKKKSSSSSSKSPSSTDTFDRSTGRSYVVVQEKDSGDTVGYLVDGKIQKELPKKSSGGSSKNRTITASNKGQTVETVMNDTRTGQTTRTVQDLERGKTISQITEKTPIAVQEQRRRMVTLQEFKEQRSIEPEVVEYQEKFKENRQQYNPKYMNPDFKRKVSDSEKAEFYYRELKADDRPTQKVKNLALTGFYGGKQVVKEVAGVGWGLVKESEFNVFKKPDFEKADTARFNNPTPYEAVVGVIDDTANYASQNLPFTSKVVGSVGKTVGEQSIEKAEWLKEQNLVPDPLEQKASKAKNFLLDKVETTSKTGVDLTYSGYEQAQNPGIKNKFVGTLKQDAGIALTLIGESGKGVLKPVETAKVAEKAFAETPRTGKVQDFILDTAEVTAGGGAYAAEIVSNPKAYVSDELIENSALLISPRSRSKEIANVVINEPKNFLKASIGESIFVSGAYSLGKAGLTDIEVGTRAAAGEITNIAADSLNRRSSTVSAEPNYRQTPFDKPEYISLDSYEPGKAKSKNKPQNIEADSQGYAYKTENVVDNIADNIADSFSFERPDIEVGKNTKINAIEGAVIVGNSFNQGSEIGYSNNNISEVGYDNKNIEEYKFDNKFKEEVKFDDKYDSRTEYKLDYKTDYKFDTKTKTGYKTDTRFDYKYDYRYDTRYDYRFDTRTDYRVPKMPKSKSLKVKKKQSAASAGEGIYVSSLGGLILNKKAKNPPKTLTGLEIRGIKLR